MTAKETGTFLNELYALYPNGIRDTSDISLTASIWDEALKDYEYTEIHNALLTYFQQDSKGYVPTAGQLIELARPRSSLTPSSDHEFWGWG